MPFAIYAYTGKLPTEISLNLSLQGEMHEQFYQHIIESKGSTFRTILSFSRALVAPLIFGSIILTGAIALMTIMLCWRHRSNIKNMIEGKEHKIGEKKSTKSVGRCQ